MENYTTYEDKENKYIPYVCEEVDKTIQHKKLVPHCFNETKLNCVTLWETNDNGEKVSQCILKYLELQVVF